jgi:competence protein ComEC
VLLVFACWPSMPSDIGFALSVAATLGLLVVAPELANRLPQRWPHWLRLAIAVSASAQLMCTPILLQFQAGLPLYSIAANLFVEPLVAPVTVIGLAALLLVPILPWAASLLVFVASIATNYIVGLAEFFANLPEAMVPWMPGFAGVLVAGLLVACAIVWAKLKPGRLRRAMAAALLLVAGFELMSAGLGYLTFVSWPTSDWFVISCDVGQGDATLIRSAGQVALIDVGRDSEPIGKCLDRMGIHHLDLLVLTHFDMDHVGGVEGALTRESIDKAMITSYSDNRPGANFCRDELTKFGLTPILGGVGVTGVLGDFKWRVLSPHPGAPEAEDSNDGSVTMLFDSPKVSILTLADLGEKGQMRLAREKATWMPADFFSKPLVLKVSHHGSADQYPEFIEALHPKVALISVGLHNGYGHPTKRALRMLRLSGAEIERTDHMGSVAIGWGDDGLVRSVSGASLVGVGR